MAGLGQQSPLYHKLATCLHTHHECTVSCEVNLADLASWEDIDIWRNCRPDCTWCKPDSIYKSYLVVIRQAIKSVFAMVK